MVLVCELLFSLLFLAKACATSPSDCCSDCVTVPRAPRLCKVQDADEKLLWGSVNPRCTTYINAQKCTVYTGMELTIKCELTKANNERIEIFGNNSLRSSSDTLKIGKVGMEDDGDYECRVVSNSRKKISKLSVEVRSGELVGCAV